MSCSTSGEVSVLSSRVGGIETHTGYQINMKRTVSNTIELTPDDITLIVCKALNLPEDTQVTYVVTAVSDYMDRFSRHEFSKMSLTSKTTLDV